MTLCGSSVLGLATITGTSGYVLLGDAGDDGLPACAGDSFTGLVTLDHNAGQLELGGAQALGAVDVTDISGTGPDQESTLTEIEGNRITGALICGGNTPPPTNDGQPNKVLGGRFGQCAAPGF